MPLPQVVGLSMINLLLQLRRLMRNWFRFPIFFISLVILLFMFGRDVEDIKIIPILGSLIVVYAILFSLVFLLPSHILNPEQLIAAIIIVNLVYLLLVISSSSL